MWPRHPNESEENESFPVKINGTTKIIRSGEKVVLQSGQRITLVPGIYHEFYPESEECVIGEVSTKNDDLHDNFFVNPKIGRFPQR